MDSVFIEIQDSAIDLMSVVSFRKDSYEILGKQIFSMSFNMSNRVSEDIRFIDVKERDEAFTEVLKILQGL